MDRSNIDIFTDVCRASEFYDSDNPTFWHTSELNLDTIVSYLEDDYKNLAFIADTQFEYTHPYTKSGDDYTFADNGGLLTKSQNLIIYNAEQVDPVLIRIVKWIDTIGRRGL
jgi:hypothetical protein